MNIKINLYLPILLCALVATSSAYCMKGAVLVAASQVIHSNNNNCNSGSPVKKLNLSAPVGAECSLCTATKSLVAFFGCSHLFCRTCKDNRPEKTCPLCSIKVKQCAMFRKAYR